MAKRGRPPKSAQASTNMPNADIVQVPRRRGRPPRSDTAAATVAAPPPKAQTKGDRKKPVQPRRSNRASRSLYVAPPSFVEPEPEAIVPENAVAFPAIEETPPAVADAPVASSFSAAAPEPIMVAQNNDALSLGHQDNGLLTSGNPNSGPCSSVPRNNVSSSPVAQSNGAQPTSSIPMGIAVTMPPLDTNNVQIAHITGPTPENPRAPTVMLVTIPYGMSLIAVPAGTTAIVPMTSEKRKRTHNGSFQSGYGATSSSSSAYPSGLAQANGFIPEITLSPPSSPTGIESSSTKNEVKIKLEARHRIGNDIRVTEPDVRLFSPNSEKPNAMNYTCVTCRRLKNENQDSEFICAKGFLGNGTFAYSTDHHPNCKPLKTETDEPPMAVEETGQESTAETNNTDDVKTEDTSMTVALPFKRPRRQPLLPRRLVSTIQL